VLPRAAGRQPGSAQQRGALTDHGNSAAAPQVRVRHAWQQGGDPLIGSNGAVRGMPAGAAAGRRAHCNLWSARAHRRHTYATVLPATIDGIRAHFGNPTQITLLRMPVCAGSPLEKTVHNCGSVRAQSWPEWPTDQPISPATSRSTRLSMHNYAKPPSTRTDRICRGSSVKRTLLSVVATVLLGLGGAWSGRIYGWPAMLCGGR
jgi:hypothetical protein